MERRKERKGDGQSCLVRGQRERLARAHFPPLDVSPATLSSIESAASAHRWLQVSLLQNRTEHFNAFHRDDAYSSTQKAVVATACLSWQRAVRPALSFSQKQHTCPQKRSSSAICIASPCQLVSKVVPMLERRLSRQGYL